MQTYEKPQAIFFHKINTSLSTLDKILKFYHQSCTNFFLFGFKISVLVFGNLTS